MKSDTVKINGNRKYQLVKDVLSKDTLFDLYVNKNLTARQIAQNYNCHETTIGRNLTLHNIKKLDHWERLKLPEKLTDEQTQLLVGNLLGDGHLSKDWKNAYFTITQEIKRFGYIRWLANRYKPWVTQKDVVVKQARSKLNDKWFYYKLARIITYSHPIFNYWYEKFYPNGKKIIPKEIESLLTPISLSTWYADDGCLGTYSIDIATYGYDVKDIELVSDILLKKYQIKCSARLDNGKPRLYILTEGRDNFFKIVSPTLMQIPCLIYKVPKRYRHLESSQTIRLTDKVPSEDIVDGPHCQ